MTAETYHGWHGYSLRLDGLEPGINDASTERMLAELQQEGWHVPTI